MYFFISIYTNHYLSCNVLLRSYNKHFTYLLTYLSPSHTGSYDFVIVRLVAIWSATTDRQCLLRSPFTIARSGVFFTIGCRSYVTLHDNLLFMPSGQL